MNSRLQQFLNAENLTQAQFADSIDVARASISHILAGRNKPGFEFIESLAKHYPALNIEWFITGKGRMYKTASEPAQEPVRPSLPQPEDDGGLLFGEDLIFELGNAPEGSGFEVFTDAAAMKNGSVRGINVKGQGGMARKKIDALVTFAKGYGAKGLPYIQLKDDGSVKCSFGKFMTEDEIAAIVERMGGEKGDLLLIAADQNKIVWNVLGALRLKLGEELGLIDHNRFDFLWVVEFPLLEWSDEEERFVAMHHPFTMPMDEDWHLIDSDPGAVRAKAYDIVLNGVELGGGSVRIHQNDIQEKMFEVIGLKPEEAQEKFGFLLTAFIQVRRTAARRFGLWHRPLCHADDRRREHP